MILAAHAAHAVDDAHPVLFFFELYALPALLVLCRLGGVAIFGPILGSQAVPWRIRALLTVAIAGATAPLVIGQLGGDALSVARAVHRADEALGVTGASNAAGARGLLPSLPAIAILVGGEIAVGAVIGLIASIPLIAAQIGGLLCGQQLGLGFGRFYLPAMDDEGDALEQMCFLFALVLFIAVGGIEQMVLATAESYRWLAPGMLAAGSAGADAGATGGVETIARATDVVVGLLGGALELGLRVAAPVLAIVALESIALGFVGRTVPALNVLSVGFVIRIAAGIAVLALGVGVIRMAIDGFVDDALGAMRQWATGGAG